MADTSQGNIGQCEIIRSVGKDDGALIPSVDDKYYDAHSAYQKCKCIDKIKSSLEILSKVAVTPQNQKEYSKISGNLGIYKVKYLENKCDDVFKNYIATNDQEIYNTTTQADKLRIETESIKQRNTKIYIGATILFVALGMIVIYRTRKD